MPADDPVDLSNCDREPIHQLGAIQPFGFLLAAASDWTIARASENVIDFIGVAARDIVGAPLSSLVLPDAFESLRRSAARLGDADSIERLFGLELISGSERRFDCALHASGGGFIIEAEPTGDDPPVEGSGLIRSIMGRLDDARDLAGFLDEGARAIRALTGFDRVMVYRFDRDGSGEVVAEAAGAGVGSFLNLRFPASDIPQQARRLYVRVPFRIIVDVNAAPVAIVPERDRSGAPIDLSLSILRAVSPIHIDYLKNMGVSASLSISIVVEGKLWGLFACHHYAPRRPAFDRRSLAELIGQMFGMKLEARERRTLADYDRASRKAADRLLATIAGDAALLKKPQWVFEAVRGPIPCDGVAVLIDGALSRWGLTPPDSGLQDILRKLKTVAAGAVFAIDRIVDLCPDAESYAAEAAGLLAIPISHQPRDYVVLFRREKVRTIVWGGDPREPAGLGHNGARLTPRASFDAWQEEVRLCSEPFTDAELHVAETLRISLVEIVLHLADLALQEQLRAAERQELLIAELNHRARNVLTLIRGLVRLTGSEKVELAHYIDALEGRIGALARAHNQLTQSSLGPSDLRELIETEAVAYASDGKSRFSISGEQVLLDPGAVSTLALVFHELLTNSAKYGSLSGTGGVKIAWRFLPDGDLALEWREFGGPPVQPPSRKGFGRVIIERSVAHNLGGRVETRFLVTGLEASFVVPASHLRRGEKADAGSEPAPPAPIPGLPVGSALLVEDSLIIAMETEDMLKTLGVETVTTAGSVRQALAAIERNPPDFALLDVNLGSETSIGVADRLTAAGVPYLFVTGYGEKLRVPAEHAHAPILQKPYTAAQLAAALAGLRKG